jgi:hypothetical protein
MKTILLVFMLITCMHSVNAANLEARVARLELKIQKLEHQIIILRAMVDPRRTVRPTMRPIMRPMRPLGFARKKARDLSQEVVKLGVDLASFNNINTADVMRDLQSALVGNTETVRKYGVILTAVNTEQKAMEMSGKNSAKQLTQSEKAAARLAIILESTTDAQGDAERTAHSLANRWRAVESQGKELAVQMGNALTPAALKLLDVVQELAPDMKELFSSDGGGTKLIKSTAEAFVDLIKAMSSLFNSPEWEEFNSLRKEGVDLIAENFKSLIQQSGPNAGDFKSADKQEFLQKSLPDFGSGTGTDVLGGLHDISPIGKLSPIGQLKDLLELILKSSDETATNTEKTAVTK